MSEYAEISGSKLSEFLDANRGQNLTRNSVRSDISLLRSAGVDLDANHPWNTKSRIMDLEYFLLRTGLYEAIVVGSDVQLKPHRIENSWSDYARALRIDYRGNSVHLPFFGSVAFKVNAGDSCHPESSSNVEAVLVQPHGLNYKSSQDTSRPLYRARQVPAIVELGRELRTIPESAVKASRIQSMAEMLVKLKLAERNPQGVRVDGEGLLLGQVDSGAGDNVNEKVARVILRRAQSVEAQVSSVIGYLRYRDEKDGFTEPIGEGARSRLSSKKGSEIPGKGGRVRSDFRHYQLVEGNCSFDPFVSDQMLTTASESPGFAAFGAFFDCYHRNPYGANEKIRNHTFLTWLTSTVSELAYGVEEGLWRTLKWTPGKILRFRRHLEHLQESSQDLVRRLGGADATEILKLQRYTEPVDFNIHREGIVPCSSNILCCTKTPVSASSFELTVTGLLKGEEPYS